MNKLLKKLAVFLFLFSTAAFILFWTLPLPGDISILMYHFVGTELDAKMEKNYVSEKSLERQMSFLKRFGYHVISMQDYEAIRKGQQKPRGREVVLTFDDGHHTFDSKALPILKNYSFPVMLFLISDWLKGEPAATGSMTEETVKRIHSQYSWISIGAHTKSHRMLSELTDAEVEEEIIGSKKDLEAMFGVPIRYLAYPFGNYDDRSIEAVKKAGYQFAFTTSPKKLRLGVAGPGDFQLNRIKISRNADNPVILWCKLSGFYQFFKLQSHRLLNKT